MGCIFFSGFETGDFSEWGSLSGTVAIVNSPTISGGYCAKVTSAGAPSLITSKTGLNKSTFIQRHRFQVHVTSNPASGQDFGFFRIEAPGAALIAIVGLTVSTGGALELYYYNNIGGAQAGGNVSINADKTYLIEVKVVISATVGIIEWKLDGDIKGTLVNQNTGSTNVDNTILRMGMTSGSAFALFDDANMDDANYPGTGHCIARQAKAGTPTYNTFTKVVGATAQECWSETPFSATKSCTSITSGGAQTMLSESFSVVQSGHGSEVLKGFEVVNGIKVAMIGKVGVGSSHSIRRRFGGADTDTAKTLTTSDAYYETAPFVDSIANLNSCEIGVLHGANTNLLTIEDMWIMVDYAEFPYHPVMKNQAVNRASTY